MTILEKKSKRLLECLKRMYLRKEYSVEYIITLLESYKDNGKITVSDYEEYYEYFCDEMDKQNAVEVVEESAEETVENDTVDNQAQDEEIENQEVDESAE